MSPTVTRKRPPVELRPDRPTFRQRRNYAITEQVFAFICAYAKDHTYPPTLDEIAAACYIARSTVLRHVDRLEGEGRIERDPYISRGITIRVPCPDVDPSPAARDRVE